MTTNTPLNVDACVLLVEDHMAMRKIIKTVLLSIGVKSVVEAADGFEAVALLEQRNKGMKTGDHRLGGGRQSSQKRPIEFIICDWIMPKMTGLELLQVIRADEKLKKLPFMMLTAEDGKEQVVQAMELGISDYVVKPFNASVLEQKLRKLLGAAKRRSL